MARHIFIINGAPRAQGNTDALLDKFREGLNLAGLEVSSATLRDLKISDCIGCCQCLKEQTCHFQDDMTHLREAIVKADVLVFASPIYWCEVTGLLKTFIDRLYFFHHPVNSHLVANKKALIFTTLGEKKAEYESEVLVEFYKRLLGSLKIEILDMFFFPDLMEKEAILQKPEYLQVAYDTGKNLLSQLK